MAWAKPAPDWPSGWRPWLSVSLILVLAGCTAPAETPVGASAVVVAIIDSGINPYHDVFRLSSEAALNGEANLIAAAAGADLVELATSGGYDDRRAADDAFWSSLERQTLVRFEGTRLLGYEVEGTIGRAVIEDATVGHGAGVASLVAREAPGVVIVMVGAYTVLCEPAERSDCVGDPSMAAAVGWAANQSWIDVISASVGIPGNPPGNDRATFDGQQFLRATSRAAAAGKMVLISAGNNPAPSSFSSYNGPPWVMAVGGAEPGPRGDTAVASRFPDVVANFTEYRALAGCLDCYAWGQGTSYAAPIVAGTLAQAIHEARVSLGHKGGITPDGCVAAGVTRDGRDVCLTNADFRRALNLTAEHFGPTDWDPSNPSAPSNETLAMVLGSSAPVVVPPAQQGWGYVHGGLAVAVAERALAGDDSVPAGKEATAAWMNAYADARARYWERS